MQMTSLKERAAVYRALGEPTRLDILSYLADRDECACVCHLSKKLKKDQSVIFRHLQVLKDAGIINTHKKDRFLLCCVKDRQAVKRYLGV